MSLLCFVQWFMGGMCRAVCGRVEGENGAWRRIRGCGGESFVQGTLSKLWRSIRSYLKSIVNRTLLKSCSPCLLAAPKGRSKVGLRKD